MAKPNLALIPATIGDKVYSILPSDGVGDFDFTRASTATRINAQGLIEEVASGENRLNYSLLNGEVVGCPHLLLEPQSTNLYSNSNYNASTWTASSIDSVTSNYAISPDGTQNAFRVVMSSSGSLIYSGGTGSSGTNTVSVYAKSNTNTEQKFRFFGNGTTSVSADMTVNQEWQRFEFSAAFSFVTWGLKGASVSATNDILFFGFQHEVQSYPTSYIPTSGSTVTRAAETCTGSGDAATFNDSEGVLMAEFSALADDLNIEGISVSDGSSSNRVVIFKWNSSNSIRARVTSSGVNTLNQTITISDVTTLNKIAVVYKTNDFQIWVNGIKLFTDTSGSTPIGLNELNFNSDGIGGSAFLGKTKQLQYFDLVLDSEQLEQLTSWDSFRDMAEGQLYSIQ